MMAHSRQQLTLLLVLATIVLVVTGCSGQVGTPEPTEDVAAPAEEQGIVSATAEVIPAQWATLSFPISGQLVSLAVEEGMDVEAGDVLARLDTTDLDIALARAQAALGVAEANLALAQAGPRDEEIEQARDRLAAANARVSVAIAERDRLRATPDPNQVLAAQAQVDQAALNAQNIQEAYDDLMGMLPTWDDYGFEPGDRTPLDREQDLRNALELANLQLAAAQANLEQLLAGPRPEAIAVANAQIWVAAAQRDAAQAYLDLVMAGPAPEEIAVAEAEVEQARAAVEAARIERDQGLLKAPFNGTISEVRVDEGEWIGPGQPVLLIGDLNTLRVETTDLNELDVARIKVGDRATVTFDALPEVSVQGTVVRIAPKSSEGAGVNYTVIIELSEVPAALRWGMTAFVDIVTG
mgnify:CR=1 FL=1